MNLFHICSSTTFNIFVALPHHTYDQLINYFQIPNQGPMNSGAGDCSKLYDDVGEYCPHANVTQVIEHITKFKEFVST